MVNLQSEHFNHKTLTANQFSIIYTTEFVKLPKYNLLSNMINFGLLLILYIKDVSLVGNKNILDRVFFIEFSKGIFIGC